MTALNFIELLKLQFYSSLNIKNGTLERNSNDKLVSRLWLTKRICIIKYLVMFLKEINYTNSL